MWPTYNVEVYGLLEVFENMDHVCQTETRLNINSYICYTSLNHCLSDQSRPDMIYRSVAPFVFGHSYPSLQQWHSQLERVTCPPAHGQGRPLLVTYRVVNCAQWAGFWISHRKDMKLRKLANFCTGTVCKNAPVIILKILVSYAGKLWLNCTNQLVEATNTDLVKVLVSDKPSTNVPVVELLTGSASHLNGFWC